MKYRSDDDKCYGVAGMAVGLSIFDATHLLNSVSVDADGLDCIDFTPEFYFAGNPRLNAKEAWQELFSHYQITIGLVIANTMCRKMILDHGVIDRKLRNSLFNALCDEGKDMCDLEKDEVQPIFDRYYSHLMRIFSDHEMCRAIERLAKELKQHRTFSRVEITDLLRQFSIM
jgi:hypothetical protein